MPVNYVTVYSTFSTGNNVPSTGTVSFTPSSVLTDVTDNLFILPVPVICLLNSNGYFTVQLAATDNVSLVTPNRQSWTYKCVVSCANLYVTVGSFSLPAVPSSVELTSILGVL